MQSRSEDHFSTIAAAYARGRFGYPAALFDHLSGLCEEHGLAWDCATGSGQAVPGLASRFRNVIATDISGELLEQAEKFPNVVYTKTPAENSGIGQGRVDLATVAQAIHWFDLPSFWVELKRVLKRRAVFAFWGYTWPIVDARVDALLDLYRLALQPYWPERSAALQEEFRKLDAPFERLSAPAFEIGAAWTRSDYLTHVHTWSAVRYCRDGGRNDINAAFESQLGQAWPENEQREVHWPLHLKVYRL
jgi:SAM-dependent methyltransferase